MQTDQRQGADGRFGMDADWRFAIQEENSDGGLGVKGWRGEACTTQEQRREARDILEKRRVVACLRTKDYGRFLPEWLAYHYAIGVDEVSIYDDDSTDSTSEILKPFVEAGLVRYVFHVVNGAKSEMVPLNRCLAYYLERKKNDPGTAPNWLLFHDTGEYIYPVDTNSTILQSLENHSSSCCVLVPRIQYGSGGFSETPRGLVMENFLTHQAFNSKRVNQKVMVNLDPTESDNVAPRLRSMHNADGCVCHSLRIREMRINHYLGSHGGYVARLARYWPKVVAGERDAIHRFRSRDINDATSDTITHWSCAAREILFRVAHGLDLDTGL
ncbi:unnamed protein product [Hapterophycus canaliculatus]